MIVRVLAASSANETQHLHIRSNEIPQSVSAGLENEQTLTYRVPIEVREARITLVGQFGSALGSSVVAIDIGPDGEAFVNLFSVSADFTTSMPVQVDHVLRFVHTVPGEVASVDAWVG